MWGGPGKDQGYFKDLILGQIVGCLPILRLSLHYPAAPDCSVCLLKAESVRAPQQRKKEEGLSGGHTLWVQRLLLLLLYLCQFFPLYFYLVFLNSLIFTSCVEVFCLRLCLCITCLPGGHGGQVPWNRSCGCWEWKHDPLQENKGSYLVSHLSSLLFHYRLFVC